MEDSNSLPTFENIDREIRSGLRNERTRLRQAGDNYRTYLAHFDSSDAERMGRTYARSDVWDVDKPDVGPTRYDRTDFALTAPVMQRIVNTLCGNLYKKSPTRELADRAATDWIERVYRRNKMAGKWQMADKLTAVGGFSAFQFSGDTDPAAPVKIQLWGPDQLVVWLDPNDQSKVAACAILDRYDSKTRLTLWTPDWIAYYTTRKSVCEEWNGSQTFDFLSKKPNPYRIPSGLPGEGEGFLPFAFQHFYEPTSEFPMDGPGNGLKELNDYLNFGLDDLGDGVRYLSKPIGVAEGVDEAWDPPIFIKPGMFLHLPAAQIDAVGNGPVPTLRFVSPELQFVQVVWSHLNSYLDTQLEMAGIPPSTIRLILEARSGIAVLSERAPLLEFAEQRRRPFAGYEEEAIRMALLVGAAHRIAHGRTSGGTGKLLKAYAEPGLVLGWPRLYVDLPGPERDRADLFRVTTGQASLIDLVQEREDCTRDQALKRLVRVKDDNDLLTSLGINPVPNPQAAQPGGSAGDQGGDMAGLDGGTDEDGLESDDGNNLDDVGGGGNQPDQGAGRALATADRFGGET